MVSDRKLLESTRYPFSRYGEEHPRKISNRDNNVVGGKTENYEPHGGRRAPSPSLFTD
jgi:hypothetical protein